MLALAVVNPKQFAIRYLSQDDPVSIAKVILKGEFRRYAELRAYDRLRRDDLDYRARHTLGVGSNKDLGLDIISVHDLVILMDPHKQKERDITRAEELIRLETTEKQKTEVLKNVFNLQQKRLDDQYAREQHTYNRIEESRDEEEKRRQAQLDRIAPVLTDGIIRHIVEDQNLDTSYEEIMRNNPMLPDFFAPPPSSGNAGYIASPHSQNFPGTAPRQSNDEDEAVDGVAETDAAAPRGLSAQTVSVLALPDLGFTVMPTTLTPAQMQVAASREQEAFMVCQVAQHGPADLAGLKAGDTLVKVNGERVSNAEALADIVRLRNQMGQLPLQMLRGEQPITCTLVLTT